MSDRSSLQQHVDADLVRHLYKHLPVSQIGSAVAALAIVVGMWQAIPGFFLSLWLVLHVLVIFARLLLYAVYKRALPIPNAPMPIWERRFMLGALAGGAVWGWATFFLMQFGGLPEHMLVLFAIGGILAGASQSLASNLRCYLAFALPAVLPLLVWLALQWHGVYPFMAVLLGFFALASWLMACTFHRTLAHSFRLRYENIDLVESLGVEVKDRELSQNMLQSHNRILEMLATQNSPLAVMNAINQLLETQIPDSMSSVMLLENTGKKLLSTAGSSLPETYTQAINGVAAGPDACASAVHGNRPAYAADIAAHPAWQGFRDVALAHGLRACHAVPVRDVDGNAVGVLALYFPQPHALTAEEESYLQSAAHLAGVTVERIKVEKRLRHLAHYDALTGLPNRTLFMDRLHQAMAWARRSKRRFALLYIDLDKFKEINDCHGHAVGDAVLREAASRLRAGMRDVDTAARMGGDEFTVIIGEIHDAHSPMVVAEKLVAALGEPIRVEQGEYRIGASIGIAIYPTDSRDADKLIGLADAAMYRAKQAGGNVSMLHASGGRRQKHAGGGFF